MSKNNSKGANRYSISQNFLTSRKTIDRIIRIANLGPKDSVIEIGAGKGHITKALARKCKSVRAYEIDEKLYQKLLAVQNDFPNCTIKKEDFLKAILPSVEYKIFSNIPFSITTNIVRKITDAPNPPKEAYLIMEKGAAKRFCGKPADGLSSLLLKPFFDLKIVYYFRKEDFHPSPSANCVLLCIRRKETPDIPLNTRQSYQKFITHSFQHGLFGPNHLLTKKQIATSLKQSHLPQIERSGNTLYVQWLCLFRCYEKFHPK